MAANCTIPQAPNGENSKLYQRLHKICKNNYLANYVYATYVAKNIGNLMENNPTNPIKRNRQGEHDAQDVYNFLHVADIANDIRSKAMAGIDPNTGGLKVYTDYNEAINDAITFNSAHKGRVAKIVQRGSDFVLSTTDVNRDNLLYKEELESQKQLWEELGNEFQNAGINIDDFSFMKDVANPMNFSHFLNYLDVIKNGQNSNLTKQDLQALLTMGVGLSQVQNMITRWGSIEDAATKVFDAFTNGTVAPSTMQFINNTLDLCKNYPLNVTTLRRTLEQRFDQVIQNSENLPIQKEWENIAQQVGLRGREASLIGDRVTSLTDAANNIILGLQRQLNNLKKYGLRSQLKTVEDKIITLQNRIQQQEHYIALLDVLNDIDGMFDIADGLMRGLSNNGNMMQFIKQRADVFNTINNLLNNYQVTVQALCNLSKLNTIEVNLTPQDRDTLESTAEKIRKKMENLREKLLEGEDSLGEKAMLDLMFEVMGQETPTGLDVARFMELENKSTLMEHLYSMGRSTQPVFALMGTVISDARMKRDRMKREISKRIARAEYKLRQSGSDSRFMYNSFGYIISDIDWIKYNKARNAKIYELKQLGFSGIEFQQALRSWEDANTVERVVDTVSQRRERVPSNKYRQTKEMANLTAAQREYYTTMMQIKGELGTLMPTYAQHHYLPPQIRNSTLDVLADCIKGRLSARDTWRVLKEKMKLLKIKEDDTDFVQNALSVEGEDYKVTQGTSKGTKQRDIPIFYMRKLANQSELLKNFSSALESLSGTATNYDCMNSVKSILEMMQVWIEEKAFVPTEKNEVELSESMAGVTAKKLADIAKKDELTSLLDGYLEKHLYGVQRKDTGIWSRIGDLLLRYNSVAKLAANIKGWANNAVVGEYQTIIEAAGARFFNLADYGWAIGYMLGNTRLTNKNVFFDWITGRDNSMINLLVEMFDPSQEIFEKSTNKKYYKHASRRILSSFNSLFGYSSGEYMFHVHVMLAMLHHAKVYHNGKQVRVLGTGNSIFEKVKEDGVTHLKIKDGVTVDKDGKIPVTMEGFIDALKGQVKECNQNLHGSMNQEDKGLIAQKFTGRAVMQFRQWMVEMYSSRFRKEHWSAYTKQWEKGFQREFAQYYWNYMKTLVGIQVDDFVKIKTMKDPKDKLRMLSNRRKFWMEQFLIAGLNILGTLFGGPSGSDDWWERMGKYQLKRLVMDANLTSPFGVFQEAKTMMNQPVAVFSAVNSLMYPILGIGQDDYWKNVYHYTIPWVYGVEKTIDFEHQDNVFTIFVNKYN